MSMLPPLQGHHAVRHALADAARADTLPGSLLLHGPAGVGKQRLGLWLGQLLLCTGPAAPAATAEPHHNGERASDNASRRTADDQPLGDRQAEAPAEDGIGGAPGEDPVDPCGVCHGCRLVRRLEHPDLHWFFPLPRPRRASSPEKLAEALEDARAAELEARRAEPYRAIAPGEPVGLYLAQIQVLRRRAAARPALGRRSVFLIGQAELLVPQESSPEAANALLKVLEEPAADTTFILTADDPGALLPTLRSRLLPVRLRSLAATDIGRFLTERRAADDSAARTAARLGQGSIGRALAFLPADDGEPGPLEVLRQRARRLLEAAAADSPLLRHTAALAHAPTGARGEFLDVLDSLALWIRDLAATADGADTVVVNADARDLLVDLTRRLPAAAAGAPDALRAIDEARALAYGNVNPQLTVSNLLRTIRRALSGDGRAPAP